MALGSQPARRRFDLIAFDWDGTLFDSTRLITECIQLAVTDVGGQTPSKENASYVIGMPLLKALAHAAPDVPADRYDRLAERYRLHYQQRKDELTLFEGTLSMLQWLKTNQYLIAIATGKSRSGLNSVLEDTTLKGIFDDTRTSDETAGKPDPRMLHELMHAMGVSADRTLMVGDTSHDLEMAKRAGCPSVAVSFGAHGVHEFKGHEPLFLAHSTAELAHWLKVHG
jgi:phosphoglycolate phosphatase